ncbi:hypothetical protein K474DRAFT_1705712 [Panus rudis PR-1116 ss-1]|nr:hypothetical protein K474DRAFT_1705712 [Panus rudis PR-1116 ss-1]
MSATPAVDNTVQINDPLAGFDDMVLDTPEVQQEQDAIDQFIDPDLRELGPENPNGEPNGSAGLDGEELQQDMEGVTEVQLWMAAQLLRLNEQFARVHPPNALWVIPQALDLYIEQYVFAVITSPSLPGYVKKSMPINLVVSILKHNQAHSGLNRDITDDAYRMSIVVHRIRTRLTDRRAQLKSKCERSLGVVDKDTGARNGCDDILELAKNVLASYNPNNNLGNEHVITIEFCARLAFIRRCLVSWQGCKGESFWKYVDGHLKDLRDRAEEDPQGQARVSRFFENVLQDDMRMYGNASLDNHPRGLRGEGSVTQQVADLSITDSRTIGEDEV